jgi:hypothetical protein
VPATQDFRANRDNKLTNLTAWITSFGRVPCWKSKKRSTTAKPFKLGKLDPEKFHGRKKRSA